MNHRQYWADDEAFPRVRAQEVFSAQRAQFLALSVRLKINMTLIFVSTL